MILGIDHVGVITEDPAGVAGFLTALGMGSCDQGIAQSYGVTCEFWQHQERPAASGQAAAPGQTAAVGQAAVEIVSPAREDSAVSAMLARSGPGLHHVAFTVSDIDAERERLRRSGFAAVDVQPQAGARPGMRVAFLFAPKPASLLIELVEYS